DPNRHDHRNLPTIIAGGMVKGGSHIQADKGTPMTNAMLSMMEALGVHEEKLGDSSGRYNAFLA
ncbi:MAG TPA: hypothetical protein VFS01_02880, partial [Rhizomicrobium sp.]|nr:hypothetical protein [Rhizomicrobium sp.]